MCRPGDKVILDIICYHACATYVCMMVATYVATYMYERYTTFKRMVLANTHIRIYNQLVRVSTKNTLLLSLLRRL